MRIRLWLATVLICACGGGSRGASAPADSASEDDPELAGADTVLPSMPDVPDRRRGHLVAVGVGALDSTWSWPARAGRCARPPMLFVIPTELGNTGGSVLLELPPGDLTLDYPVRFADSTGMPDPPAAMLGFQFFDQQRGDAYQAGEGVVTVTELDERRVSGRFQVTVRHISTDQQARVAGVFYQLDVEPLPPAYCERLQTAQDSLLPSRN